MRLNTAGPRLPAPEEHKLLAVALVLAVILWFTTGVGVAA